MKCVKFTGFGFLIFLFLFACCKNKKKEDEKEGHQEYDRTALLANMADNIIFPNYDSLKKGVDVLNEKINQFNLSPSLLELEKVRSAFKSAYAHWQHCSVFEFGPAMQENLRLNLNTFPVDSTQINNNISSGNYDFDAVVNIDAKGFPALDYILFTNSYSDTALVNSFVNDSKKKSYLADVATAMKVHIDVVFNAWNPAQGNYVSTFKTKSGTDVGSSLGELVNQLSYDLEVLRTAKIGIPLGKKTLGTPLPKHTEAHFSGISNELAIEPLKNLENVFLGKTQLGNNGMGLDDYLNFLDARHNSSLLSDVISQSFSSSKSALQAIPSPLSDAVTINSGEVDHAYMKLQQLVVLLKADMSSALAVLITYQDNDGD